MMQATKRIAIATALVLATSTYLLAASSTGVACDDLGEHGGSVARAAHAVTRSCDCSTPDRHRFIACAKKVIDRRVRDGRLAADCRPGAMAVVRDSTCGRPGAVVCCRTTPSGLIPSVSIEKDAASCTATQPDAACIPDAVLRRDGCHGGNCPVCGNGKIEPGEQCDGESFCEGCRIVLRLCCPILISDSEAFCWERLYSPAGTEAAPSDCPSILDGPARIGGLCSDDKRSCVPDPAADDFYTASICCENKAGCSDRSSRVAVCSEADFNANLVVGTCGSDGHCHPRESATP